MPPEDASSQKNQGEGSRQSWRGRVQGGQGEGRGGSRSIFGGPNPHSVDIWRRGGAQTPAQSGSRAAASSANPSRVSWRNSAAALQGSGQPPATAAPGSQSTPTWRSYPPSTTQTRSFVSSGRVVSNLSDSFSMRSAIHEIVYRVAGGAGQPLQSP